MQNNSYEQIISLVNGIEAGIIKCDISPHLTASLINNGFLRLINYTNEQFNIEHNNSFASIIYDDDIADMLKSIQNNLRSLESVSIEIRLVRSDKSLIWVLAKGTISKDISDNYECTFVLTDITHIKEVEIELKINERMLNFAIEQSNIIILKYNPTTDTMYSAKEIMPKCPSPDVVENFTTAMLKYGCIFPDDIKTFTNLFKSVQNGEAFSQGVFRCYNCSGELLWYDVKIASILDSKGHIVQCVVAMEDITEIHCLADENEFRKSMISDSSLAYEANITRNTVTYMEERISQNHPDKDFLCFTDLVKHFISNYIHDDFAEMFKNFCSKKTIMDIINSGRHQNSIEYRKLDYDEGRYHWYENTMSIVRDRTTDEVKIRCYIKSIDDRKLQELELKYKSERDLLSGMYNKITAEEKVCSYVRMCEHNSERCALFLIDIDKFKQINDCFGHVFGDTVITEASRKIMETFRDNDIIGRVGGDEFIILMRNIDSPKNAETKAAQLCSILNDTYVSGSMDDIVSVSIGIAVYPEHGSTYDELFQNADTALYSSKENGRNRYTMYSKDIKPKHTPYNMKNVFSKNTKVTLELE